jgi:uncharacterized protein with PIN domain
MNDEKVDKEYCPTCNTILKLLTRDSDINTDEMDVRKQQVIETYYCIVCSQEYDFEYEFEDVNKNECRN